MKILVCIAHFAGDKAREPESDWRYNRYGIMPGTLFTHEHELHKLLDEYNSWKHDVTVTIITNNSECLYGLSDKYVNLKLDIYRHTMIESWWELGIVHRKFFIENKNQYDAFIYTENDMLITEDIFNNYISTSDVILKTQLPGLIRYETKDTDNEKYLIDYHLQWKANNGIAFINDTYFEMSNLHQGCYILTQSQLKTALNSNGFDTKFVWNSAGYDKMARCFTDLVTKCGFTRIYYKNNFTKFLVHHIGNNYCTREEDSWKQILTLTQLKNAIFAK